MKAMEVLKIVGISVIATLTLILMFLIGLIEFIWRNIFKILIVLGICYFIMEKRLCLF